jgi:hypothetical protein
VIFLLEYNRKAQALVTFRRYSDADRQAAERERLTLEIDLNRRGVDHEVVILEARDDAALKRTHGRYFPEALDQVRPEQPGPR